MTLCLVSFNLSTRLVPLSARLPKTLNYVTPRSDLRFLWQKGPCFKSHVKQKSRKRVATERWTNRKMLEPRVGPCDYSTSRNSANNLFVSVCMFAVSIKFSDPLIRVPLKRNESYNNNLKEWPMSRSDFNLRIKFNGAFARDDRYFGSCLVFLAPRHMLASNWTVRFKVSLLISPHHFCLSRRPMRSSFHKWCIPTQTLAFFFFFALPHLALFQLFQNNFHISCLKCLVIKMS